MLPHLTACLLLAATSLGMALGTVIPEKPTEKREVWKTWIIELQPGVSKDGFIERLSRYGGGVRILYNYKFFSGLAVSSVMDNFGGVLSPIWVKYTTDDLQVAEACGMQADSSRALARLSSRENPLRKPYTYLYDDKAGKGVDIYVVDGGANLGHQEFHLHEGTSRMRIRCGWSYQNDNCADLDGHGTEVAALAGGLTFGTAKQANLIAVKVLEQTRRTPLSRLLAAFDYIAQEAQKTGRPSIINMSLKLMDMSGPHVPIIDSAMEALMEANIHIVAAAGNDGQDVTTAWPSTPGLILVGALDGFDKKASFSNSGEGVLFWAPGEQLTSATVGYQTDVHKNIQGTSFSAPMVAGIAAMYLSILGPLHPAETISYMREDAIILDGDACVPQAPHSGIPTDADMKKADWWIKLASYNAVSETD